MRVFIFAAVIAEFIAGTVLLVSNYTLIAALFLSGAILLTISLGARAVTHRSQRSSVLQPEILEWKFSAICLDVDEEPIMDLEGEESMDDEIESPHDLDCGQE